MMPFRSLCLVSLATTLAAAQSLNPVPLDRVRLLDGPFKEIQKLHRGGMVGKLEPDRHLVQRRS
jgi:hypothetical protein